MVKVLEKKKSLAIVFIHTGYSSYLEFSLRQAKYANPDSEIILLGDEANNRFDFITHVNMQDYFEQAEEFAKLYQHYSTNPYNYELFCFQRWFALHEFMHENHYEEVFVCDSDVLIYSNFNEFKDSLFKDKEFALAIYDAKHASAGISYWRINALNAFCKLLPSFYTDKEKLQKLQEMWDYNQKHKILGGFSDMTAVTEFIDAYDSKNYCNLIDVNDNTTFDTHINMSEGANKEKYYFKRGKKQFFWKNKIPFCKNLTRNIDVLFHLIHFQGPAKYMMAFYYTGPTFKGIYKLKFNYYILNSMAFCYKTFKIRYRFAYLFDLAFKLKAK